jgi:hypothetical protein
MHGVYSFCLRRMCELQKYEVRGTGFDDFTLLWAFFCVVFVEFSILAELS